MKRILIALSLIFFISPAIAAELSDINIAHLNQYRAGIESLQDSAEAGIITESQAEQGTIRYLELAEEVDSKYSSKAELLSYVGPNIKIVEKELTGLQKFAGWISFTNILYIFGTIIGVGSLLYLAWDFIKYFLRIFKHIPVTVYEVFLYAVSAGMIGAGMLFALPVMGQYIAFTGCIFLAGTIVLTAIMRQIEPNITRYFGILFVVFTPIAVLYDSSWIGFLSIGALMGLIRFSNIIVSPLSSALGFNDKDSIGITTAASLYVLTSFVLYRIFLPTAPYIHIFENGALFLGSFGYLGLLIASSKWYGTKNNYAVMQLVTITAGIGALFVGSVFEIGELLKIGGTFFALYLIEKTFEIPAKSARGYAILGLMISGVIYGIFTITKIYPEQVSTYLFFVN